ncbi:defensin-A-like [Armigeres subalbatus]|uniref:defensin-A-like n=1 Tax=Armigeres subalbatus TaxID=124917 RepID=UPI002ED065BC
MQSCIIIGFIALCTMTIGTMAYPQKTVLSDNVQSYANSLFDELPEESYTNTAPVEHNRQKRATCDLLSGFGVNDSACAVHCILRGNRGGYCNSKKVCVCRN